MKKIIKNLIKDKLLIISFGCALLSFSISFPKISDINWETIFSLASLMAIIQVYRYLKILDFAASLLIKKNRNIRTLVQSLVFLAFFISMFFTNDIAVITIMPLLFTLIDKTNLKLILPTVLINLSANLGSIVTPMGNPQNVFLLNYFHLNFLTFLKMALPISCLSLILLFLFSLLIHPHKLKTFTLSNFHFNFFQLFLVFLATLLVILGIFSVIPIWLMLIIASSLIFSINSNLFKKIDYKLLFTFICFFIAVGDLGRSEIIRNFFENLGTSKLGVYMSGLGLSQIISNVPATILLAPFTKLFYPLFLGVNIGGLGTLIASLANLLAFRQLNQKNNKLNTNYFKVFFLLNFISLLILGLFGWMLIKINYLK